MDSHFAPAERLNKDDLDKEIAFVGNNIIITALLHSVSGLLAVLNEHRQIITINDSLLHLLNLNKTEDVLGLRLGETLKCIHSSEMPGGCGTSEYCSTCGAVISMVASLTTDTTTENDCAITFEENGNNRDLFFRVRCVPVTYDQKRIMLLFMQDISYQQRLANLERLFYHDINGIIQGVLGASELIMLDQNDPNYKLATMLKKYSLRLASEIKSQRCLISGDMTTYQPVYSSVPLPHLLQEISDMFSNSAISKNKFLTMPKECPDVFINTEPSLLIRILANMVSNAFEETDNGDEVRVWCENTNHVIVFNVWNRKPIPADIAKRIFQRNFSTKAGMGRGLGTYSMKLFGEDILGGTVDFSTSKEDGTIFRLSLKV